ncbi:hypothetical protein like AT1G09360 [Hibiscus trionum]|uniref:Pectinesterase inhibitor domain-containing protein n=1 Tax=Hibiscus trionum TaxID=183268 RepID=A0A9W7IVA2_HIBTR|nr:hypothetical protein like AT1G09360 [Hibiscus trionum]
MSDSSKFCIYFVLLALLGSFIFIRHASCDDSPQALIDKICRQMEEYAFCNNTFNQNLKSPNADITALTQITVEQTLNIATNTHTLITGLLEKATDPAVKNALTTCENAYHVVMDSFQHAATAFFEKDYNSMFQSEKSAPRAQASCTTIFNTPPNPPNPITDQNTHARILIAMAIVAGTDLTSGHS